MGKTVRGIAWSVAATLAAVGQIEGQRMERRTVVHVNADTMRISPCDASAGDDWMHMKYSPSKKALVAHRLGRVASAGDSTCLAVLGDSLPAIPSEMTLGRGSTFLLTAESRRGWVAMRSAKRDAARAAEEARAAKAARAARARIEAEIAREDSIRAARIEAEIARLEAIAARLRRMENECARWEASIETRKDGRPRIRLTAGAAGLRYVPADPERLYDVNSRSDGGRYPVPLLELTGWCADVYPILRPPAGA